MSSKTHERLQEEEDVVEPFDGIEKISVNPCANPGLLQLEVGAPTPKLNAWEHAKANYSPWNPAFYFDLLVHPSQNIHEPYFRRRARLFSFMAIILLSLSLVCQSLELSDG